MATPTLAEAEATLTKLVTGRHALDTSVSALTAALAAFDIASGGEQKAAAAPVRASAVERLALLKLREEFRAAQDPLGSDAVGSLYGVLRSRTDDARRLDPLYESTSERTACADALTAAIAPYEKALALLVNDKFKPVLAFDHMASMWTERYTKLSEEAANEQKRVRALIPTSAAEAAAIDAALDAEKAMRSALQCTTLSDHDPNGVNVSLEKELAALRTLLERWNAFNSAASAHPVAVRVRDRFGPFQPRAVARIDVLVAILDQLHKKAAADADAAAAEAEAAVAAAAAASAAAQPKPASAAAAAPVDAAAQPKKDYRTILAELTERDAEW